MKNPIVLIAIILGIVMLIVGGLYATQPAGSLPSFFPGYKVGDTQDHHMKHAIGSILVGVACFVFAWFQSGPKTSGNTTK